MCWSWNAFISCISINFLLETRITLYPKAKSLSGHKTMSETGHVHGYTHRLLCSHWGWACGTFRCLISAQTSSEVELYVQAWNLRMYIQQVLPYNLMWTPTLQDTMYRNFNHSRNYFNENFWRTTHRLHDLTAKVWIDNIPELSCWIHEKLSLSEEIPLK